MQKLRSILLGSLFCLCSTLTIAQQVADTLFNPLILNPVYQQGSGSVVLIDEAHSNFHTLNGRFKPFANVLTKDGYVIKASSQPFSEETLSKGKILVIANALHPSNTQNWSLPTPSAFTDSEIETVNDWVKNGGSLFLIADHMPFPGAAEKLAASFGVKFYNGFAQRKNGADIFLYGEGLIENTITKGRGNDENVSSLQSFTGQAFTIPENAQAIIVLNSKYTIKMPQTAWDFKKDTPEISAENFVQGAFMPYGSGRIVIFGEAAMFTAQRQGKNEFGMNAKTASQNVQFLLNTIHWLDGILN